jgi:hypothetical protein
MAGTGEAHRGRRPHIRKLAGFYFGDRAHALPSIGCNGSAAAVIWGTAFEAQPANVASRQNLSMCKRRLPGSIESESQWEKSRWDRDYFELLTIPEIPARKKLKEASRASSEAKTKGESPVRPNGAEAIRP